MLEWNKTNGFSYSIKQQDIKDEEMTKIIKKKLLNKKIKYLESRMKLSE
jgi:transposase-like protein